MTLGGRAAFEFKCKVITEVCVLSTSQLSDSEPWRTQTDLSVSCPERETAYTKSLAWRKEHLQMKLKKHTGEESGKNMSYRLFVLVSCIVLLLLSV